MLKKGPVYGLLDFGTFLISTHLDYLGRPLLMGYIRELFPCSNTIYSVVEI